jgi:hypothetical protein
MGVFFIFEKMEQHGSFFIGHKKLFPGNLSCCTGFENALTFQQIEYLLIRFFGCVSDGINQQFVRLFSMKNFGKKFEGLLLFR